MNLIQQLEQEEIARLGKTIPEFAPGDTVVVHVRVVEGNRSRLQAYEGVVRDLAILPVPEWAILRTSTGTLDPVRMNRPNLSRRSTSKRIASHREGASRHSSMRRGASPSRGS